MNEGYDVAQVCSNGHVATSFYHFMPEARANFCQECGSKTIIACTACGVSIRGSYSGVSFAYHPPRYCLGCGSPYPWTQGRIQAARDLANELESLSEDERTVLARAVDDLVQDVPGTQVAILRFKKLMVKVGQQGASMFRDILVDIVSESVRKAIWPSVNRDA